MKYICKKANDEFKFCKITSNKPLQLELNMKSALRPSFAFEVRDQIIRIKISQKRQKIQKDPKRFKKIQKMQVKKKVFL